MKKRPCAKEIHLRLLTEAADNALDCQRAADVAIGKMKDANLTLERMVASARRSDTTKPT